MDWQPIETYDKLKNKPKYVVFYVAEVPCQSQAHPYTRLSELIVTERRFGSREVTHWKEVGVPAKEEK